MSQTIREIKLRGALGKRFGRVHRLAVDSAAEAVRALAALMPGFEEYLWNAEDRGLRFGVFVDGENIDREQLLRPCARTIDILPVTTGAKNSGAIMTIIGAILVVVGIFLIWTPFGAPLIAAGVGLMVGGIAMMLAPQPQDPASQDDANNKASYAFNGPVNTQAQGNPVPLLYGGPMLVGSAVASASIDVHEQAYRPRAGWGDGSMGDGANRMIARRMMV